MSAPLILGVDTVDNPFSDEEKKSRQQIEFKIHCAAVEQLPGAFPTITGTFLHVPNRPGSGTDGFFKQMMGAKRGASDLMISWNYGTLQCGWMEIKAPGEGLKSEQNKFLSAFDSIGWHTGSGTSVKQIFNVIEKWGVKRVHWGVKEPDIRSDMQKKHDSFDFFAPRKP